MSEERVVACCVCEREETSRPHSLLCFRKHSLHSFQAKYQQSAALFETAMCFQLSYVQCTLGGTRGHLIAHACRYVLRCICSYSLRCRLQQHMRTAGSTIVPVYRIKRGKFRGARQLCTEKVCVRFGDLVSSQRGHALKRPECRAPPCTQRPRKQAPLLIQQLPSYVILIPPKCKVA